MKSIIEDIYYGKCSSENIKEGEEYWKIHDKCEKIYEVLKKSLNEEQIKILDKLVLQSGGLEGETACTHFQEGFKLGMLIAFEVLK